MDWKGFGISSLFLLIALEKVLGVASKLRRDPEKREISMAAQHPTKEELQRLEQKVIANELYGAERRKAIYKMIDEQGQKMDLKLDALHEKINTIGRDVSSVGTQCEMINTQVIHLSSQVKRKD